MLDVGSTNSALTLSLWVSGPDSGKSQGKSSRQQQKRKREARDRVRHREPEGGLLGDYITMYETADTHTRIQI